MAHVLFLMSDTGGGHRAAARAIEAALIDRYPGQFTCELVDVWRDYTPFPLNSVPDVYGPWVNLSPGSYSALFWIGDRLLMPPGTVSPIDVEPLYPAMKKLYAEHPADVIVCVHSVFVRPGIYALRRRKMKTPFITVITDYAWPTSLWYDARVDRCLVPTPPAYERGLTLGLTAEQLKLTGAPVHPKFGHVKLTREQAKAQLGWLPNLPAVMLVGGGDGMGPLVETAKAIDTVRANCQLIVITGRNQAMKEKLDAIHWQNPTRVYGFVNNMEVLMTAADALVTKSGPGTITEAAAVGLPLILSGAIRFQESPNTEYIVQNGAGIYAPGPRRVAEAVADLFGNHSSAARLEQLSRAVHRLADADSSYKIADEIRAATLTSYVRHVSKSTRSYKS
jgi:1,2-diacylglycerol 3-beta-galactosyltransferase